MRAAPSRDEGRRGEGETRRGEQNGGDGDRRVDAVAATPRRRVVMIKMSDARERERARDASDAR